jgi:hypothetical protein
MGDNERQNEKLFSDKIQWMKRRSQFAAADVAAAATDHVADISVICSCYCSL